MAKCCISERAISWATVHGLPSLSTEHPRPSQVRARCALVRAALSPLTTAQPSCDTEAFAATMRAPSLLPPLLFSRGFTTLFVYCCIRIFARLVKGFCLQSFAKFEFELWLFNNCKFVEENNQFEAFRITNNLPPLLFLSRFCNIVCLLLYLNFRVAGIFFEIEIEHKLLNNWKSVDCRIKKQSLPPLLFCQGFATSIVY